ncbi:SphA family protein [Xanthobacter versatilis]|uniref:SphA family protein n=1 Tax=Xanthobacter autotrophicus (strain ATCC BAA-1158 / Py2) TaxID=78245 RepID=UPI00372B0F01
MGDARHRASAGLLQLRRIIRKAAADMHRGTRRARLTSLMGIRMNVSQRVIAISLLSISIMATNGALGSERGALPFAVGSTGDFVVEFPPIPGLFLVNQTSYTSISGLNGDNGKTVTGSDFTGSAVANTNRLLYSWLGDYGNFHIYSQLVVPVVTGSTTLKFYGATASAGGDTGFGNVVFSPLIVTYSFDKNNALVVAYDYASSIGTYSSTAAFNPATGYASHQPIIGFRHNDKDGFYVGIVGRGIFNETNPDTQYHSGSAIEADFRTGWNFGKLSVGLVGGYYHQYQADSGLGSLNGKTQLLNIGPAISYDFGPLILGVNIQTAAYAANTSKGTTAWLNLALPLWVPPPPAR